MSPDGKQLAEAQTKDGFLPFLVIAEMRRQGRNLPQMGERPEEFGTRPRGPALGPGGRNIFCSERTLFTRRTGTRSFPGETGGLWLLFLGHNPSYQFLFLRQLENQIGRT